MKQRYRLIRRNSRGGKFYCVDTLTKKRESLSTANQADAERIVQSKNEAERQPIINRQIAYAYLMASDSSLPTRTWQNVMDEIAKLKTGVTKERWERAVCERPFDLIRYRTVLDTQGEHFIAVLAGGTVSTNIFLRRLHNFALDMHWLPQPLIPRRQWPKITFDAKRAITFEEHQKILAGERNPEWHAYYELLWHLGGSQSDVARLPDTTLYVNLQQLCRGFGSCAKRHGVTVLGGDITHCAELSISATSIGRAKRNQVLTRRGARPGDSIFISRPLGMTPAAFLALAGPMPIALTDAELMLLKKQFTSMEPMLTLGKRLSASGLCGACMDNTDGVGQSLSELSDASKCSFIVQRTSIRLPDLVEKISCAFGQDSLQIAFNGGADFSLVGTLRGPWTTEQASARFGEGLEVIGMVEPGDGVWIEHGGRRPLKFRGWNYFEPTLKPQ